MDSTYIDIFVFTVLFLSSIKGFNDGFISESKVIVALVLGVFVSNKHSDLTKDILNEFFKIPPSMIDNVSIFASFLGVLIIVYTSSMVLHMYILKSGMLSMYDRLLGLAFALLKITITLSIILYTTLIFVNLNDKTKDFLQNSISYKFLNDVGLSLMGEYLNKEENFIDSLTNSLFDGKEDEVKKTIKNEVTNIVKSEKDNSGFIDKIKNEFLK